MTRGLPMNRQLKCNMCDSQMTTIVLEFHDLNLLKFGVLLFFKVHPIYCFQEF